MKREHLIILLRINQIERPSGRALYTLELTVVIVYFSDIEFAFRLQH